MGFQKGSPGVRKRVRVMTVGGVASVPVGHRGEGNTHRETEDMEKRE